MSRGDVHLASKKVKFNVHSVEKKTKLKILVRELDTGVRVSQYVPSRLFTLKIIWTLDTRTLYQGSINPCRINGRCVEYPSYLHTT